MKTIKFLILATLILVGGSVSAQSYKLGYLNSQEILQLMPESDSASKQYQAYTKELSDQLEAMDTEFNTKYQDYTKKVSTYSEAMSKQKQQELQNLKQSIAEFEQAAPQDMQKRQQELMQPIYAKLMAAIKKVGEVNGYTYVFDISTGGVAYFNEKTADNVLPLIKTELGLK